MSGGVSKNLRIIGVKTLSHGPLPQGYYVNSVKYPEPTSLRNGKGDMKRDVGHRLTYNVRIGVAHVVGAL